jgi:hypothetical protein
MIHVEFVVVVDEDPHVGFGVCGLRRACLICVSLCVSMGILVNFIAVETFTCLPVHSHPEVYEPMNEASLVPSRPQLQLDCPTLQAQYNCQFPH